MALKSLSAQRSPERRLSAAIKWNKRASTIHKEANLNTREI